MIRRSLLHRSAGKCADVSVRRRSLINFENTHGFLHKATRRIDELNIVAYEWQHKLTGAMYYHIDTDDRNNTFCIGFRTPAQNSKGTTHVLEHTVLCGSKKYPVRDPFTMMLRRSLSNFMNAMTGNDYTLYPFATTNTQDFCNLLDVYLDAVFHPLLREEDFKQEGHRVEIETDPVMGKRLVFNGVVFNEMRGVVSEPSQHYAHSLMKVMLPGTHYEHISGGFPPDVLKLTYEELVAFHKKHYHPSNSVTFTYGEQHPDKWMKILNEYFSSFSRGEAVTVPFLLPENRFKELKKFSLEGPLNPMGNPQRQKRVSVSFGVQQEDNMLEDMVELSVLDSLLSSGPSSPLYKALIESQIGSRYAPMRGYSSFLSSPFISYGVEGVDENRPNAEDEVLNAVISTLQNVEKEGFDQRRVKSVIFQEELQQRHRAAEYGVNLCAGLCMMGLCRARNNPLDFIDWLPHLRRLGEQQAKTLLPRISKNLTNNPHRALVSVSAKKEFLDSMRDTLTQMEEKLNKDVSDTKKEEIETETTKWLERIRAPQNDDILPTLTIKDIPRESFQEPSPKLVELKDSNSLHTIACPTNGLVYVHGLAPFHTSLITSILDCVRESLIDVPLWNSLLGNLGAGQCSYKELSIATDLVCGGFTFSPQLNQSYRQSSDYIVGTSYGFFTTKEKLREALNLLKVTLLEPQTSPENDEVRSRALSLVKARCSGVIQRIQRNGNRVATTLAVSHLTPCGAVKEEWTGLAQSTHASLILEKLQSAEEAVVREAITGILKSHEIFAKSLASNIRRGILWATCEEGHRTEVETMLTEFLRDFPDVSSTTETPSTRLSFSSTKRTPGLSQLRKELPIDTSYAGIAIANNLDWVHPHQAPLRVACQLLSNEYLHRRIREEGGAYGSGASATLNGEVGGITMSSYRDPTPEQTVSVFKEVSEWLSDSGNITQVKIDEAKLRMFSSIDAPYSVDSYGESYFLHDIQPDQKQAMRNAILAVEPRDVVDMAQYFNVSGDAAAVVGILCPEEMKKE